MLMLGFKEHLIYYGKIVVIKRSIVLKNAIRHTNPQCQSRKTSWL